jgi:hypothetical protein
MFQPSAALRRLRSSRRGAYPLFPCRQINRQTLLANHFNTYIPLSECLYQVNGVDRIFVDAQIEIGRRAPVAPMTLSAKFSLLHSELNDFLHAELGEEESGASLSVLSALTRLGVDPWAEGARLSALSRDAAARGLVTMIEMFPSEKRGSADVLALAERLAALLPQRSSSRVTGVVPSDDRRRMSSPALWLVCAVFVLVLVGMGAFGLLPGQ